eukprot:CAMPEP_0198420504 /NCGR_PEP_ID=MMETSP1452-20131203/955_1 /TAXON_ID=1181717 /ORGANISM="Synchroma pusillum, Strain CCMP3072" /LENGTH=141 /DNA_ID=CAMNT_0044140667 /DNA_START=1 /DNA_END=426 /DNA_ORIENTATION=+
MRALLALTVLAAAVALRVPRGGEVASRRQSAARWVAGGVAAASAAVFVGPVAVSADERKSITLRELYKLCTQDGEIQKVIFKGINASSATAVLKDGSVVSISEYPIEDPVRNTSPLFVVAAMKKFGIDYEYDFGVLSKSLK